MKGLIEKNFLTQALQVEKNILLGLICYLGFSKASE